MIGLIQISTKKSNWNDKLEGFVLCVVKNSINWNFELQRLNYTQLNYEILSK